MHVIYKTNNNALAFHCKKILYSFIAFSLSFNQLDYTDSLNFIKQSLK